MNEVSTVNNERIPVGVSYIRNNEVLFTFTLNTDAVKDKTAEKKILEILNKTKEAFDFPNDDRTSPVLILMDRNEMQNYNSVDDVFASRLAFISDTDNLVIDDETMNIIIKTNIDDFKKEMLENISEIERKAGEKEIAYYYELLSKLPLTLAGIEE